MNSALFEIFSDELPTMEASTTTTISDLSRVSKVSLEQITTHPGSEELNALLSDVQGEKKENPDEEVKERLVQIVQYEQARGYDPSIRDFVAVGTGVILYDNYILTARHVVKKFLDATKEKSNVDYEREQSILFYNHKGLLIPKYAAVSRGGQMYPLNVTVGHQSVGEAEGFELESDLSLVRAEMGQKYNCLGMGKPMSVDEAVKYKGWFLGDVVEREGIIRAIELDIRGLGKPSPSAMGMGLPDEKRYSGGVVLNRDGQVVGSYYGGIKAVMPSMGDMFLVNKAEVLPTLIQKEINARQT